MSKEKTMSFDVWWALINKQRDVEFKPWLKEIILKDFLARGCKERDTKANYDKALKAFGY